MGCDVLYTWVKRRGPNDTQLVPDTFGTQCPVQKKRRAAEKALRRFVLTNVPGATRTHDLLLRRQSLYPPELRGRRAEDRHAEGRASTRAGLRRSAAQVRPRPPQVSSDRRPFQVAGAVGAQRASKRDIPVCSRNPASPRLPQCLGEGDDLLGQGRHVRVGCPARGPRAQVRVVPHACHHDLIRIDARRRPAAERGRATRDGLVRRDVRIAGGFVDRLVGRDVRLAGKASPEGPWPVDGDLAPSLASRLRRTLTRRKPGGKAGGGRARPAGSPPARARAGPLGCDALPSGRLRGDPPGVQDPRIYGDGVAGKRKTATHLMGSPSTEQGLPHEDCKKSLRAA